MTEARTKVFWSDLQREHRGTRFMKAGRLTPSPEIPDRADAILAALHDDRFQVIPPDDHGRDAIERTHSAQYIAFLSSISERWSTAFGEDTAILPNVMSPKPMSTPTHVPKGLVGLLGRYTGDLAAEIREGTWRASYMSAQCAISAARLTRETGETTYALCRPPGHHAGPSWAMGFCFLNNAAIAADELRQSHAKVAVVDVDVHHGNGTQAIFYDRSDVLTTSLHSNPEFLYPFFSGYEDEIGEEEGVGFNLNVCFAASATDQDFVVAFSRISAAVETFAPSALVVALGVDALSADPHSGHKITPDGYLAIARQIRRWRLPTVFVQEGGYLSDILGEIVASFIAEARFD